MPEPREPFKLNVRGVIVTDEQFDRLCRENPELRLELTAQKELVIMPPTGYETGRRNMRLGRYLDEWAEADGTGTATDSSTLFVLPNGAKRSPDAAWVRQERENTIPKDQREGPLPLCPDFVIELRSPTDRLIDVQEKMQEYRDNGALLGLLLDPFERRVDIYRPGRPVEVLDDPETVGGDPVLPGFVLPVRKLW
ncbi:MAG: Uma2 family endonuclease [Deltaproteobacteria bacterium]|nr:Uma2 family endonuclease [Deltaproteobacteria bacterium]